MVGITHAFNVAKSAFRANESSLAIKIHNLSLGEIVGGKKGYAVTRDIGYMNTAPAGSSTSTSTVSTTGLPYSLGVEVAAINRSFTQGEPVHTGNTYDIMINGQGFFQVQMPDGTTAYTRSGVFQPNAQGQLATIEGYPLTPVITIPPTAGENVVISESGEVQVNVPGQAPQTLGQIQLATFINPNGLSPQGKNLFLAVEAASGAATVGTPGLNGVGTLLQGNRESANTNNIEEITDLIKIQRNYTDMVNAVNTGKDMSKAANGLGA